MKGKRSVHHTKHAHRETDIFIAIVALIFLAYLAVYSMEGQITGYATYTSFENKTTPPNNTITLNHSIYVNMTVNYTNNMTKFIFNFNGTGWNGNYSFYENDSLLLMMNFNNVSEFGENSTYVRDFSRYANNGSLRFAGTNNNATWTPNGRYGGGILFDGDNDFVNIPENNLMAFGTNNFTIELWANSSDFAAENVFMHKVNTGTGKGWYLQHSGNTVQFVIADTLSNFEYGTSSANLANNSWNHIIVFRNATGINFVVNGVWSYGFAPTKSMTNTDASLLIGGTDYNGTIDEVRIYNRSFTFDEAKVHYYSNLKKMDNYTWVFYSNMNNLTKGNYTYYGYSEDANGNVNATETRKIEILNAPPSISDIKLNTTSILNHTKDNLTCYVNGTDIDLENITRYNGFWYKNGTQQFDIWNATFGGSGKDQSIVVTTDVNASIYVTGFTNSFGTGASPDVWTMRFNSTGSLLWNGTFGSTGSEYGQGIAVDSNNTVIVAGYTYSFGAGDRDALVMKYNSTGFLLWNKTIGGAGGDNAIGVKADANNNIYVAAHSNSTSSNAFNDLWVIKLNASGNVTWNRTFGGSGEDTGYAIALGANSSVNYTIVVGTTNSTGNGLNDIWVFKLNSSDGLPIWNTTIGTDNEDYGQGAAVDSNGSIIVVGYTNSTASDNFDAWVIKLNASGNITWNTTINTGVNDIAKGVYLDSDDNIIIAGYTYSAGLQNHNLWTAKINPSGTLIWNKTIGGASVDFGYGIAVDSDDNIVITGYTNSTGNGDDDVWLVKYYGFSTGAYRQSSIISASTLPYSKTSNNDIWSCQARTFDLYNYSRYVASNSITIMNAIPLINNVSLVSSSGTNYTSENLLCYANVTDYDMQSLTYNGSWYRNGTQFSNFSSTSQTQGVILVSQLGNSNIATGDIWSCGLRFYDGFNYSANATSGNLTVRAAPAAAATVITTIITNDDLTELEKELLEKKKINETIERNQTNETYCTIKSASQGNGYEVNYDCNINDAQCFRIYYKSDTDINWRLWKEVSGQKGTLAFGYDKPAIEVRGEYKFGIQAMSACRMIAVERPAIGISSELMPIPREITNSDLQKLDLSRINVLAENIGTSKVEVVQTSSKEVAQQLTKEQIQEIINTVMMQIEQTGTPEAKQGLNEVAAQAAMPGAVLPTITKSLKTYEIKNAETNETQPVSKVVISLSSPTGAGSLNIVEVIPKSVSENVTQLTFSEQPVVLQADPIVKWYFDDLPPGQSKDISYTVDKKLESIDSVTVSAGEQRREIIEEKPSLVALWSGLGTGKVMIIAAIFVFIIIMLIPVFFVKGMKKGKSGKMPKKYSGGQK